MKYDKDLLLRPAVPIQDVDVEKFVAGLGFAHLREWLKSPSSVQEFIADFRTWIQPFLGENTLDSFPTVNLTSGTTGSFQDFYQIHSQRRLRVLKGEYPFHRDVFDSLDLDWKWLSVEDLESQDFVILSFPFSGHGDATPDFFDILERCESLQIPVLIDAAFAGLSRLTLPSVERFKCIQKISFSLSKNFNLGHLRCGLEFSRLNKGANALLSHWGYGPKVAAFIGQKLIKEFPLDFLYRKYRDEQLKICEALELEASPTLLFGLSQKTQWQSFARDRGWNRVCLSRLF